jgi:predicted ATP-grasp superfamily ATP-dependent carboligase
MAWNIEPNEAAKQELDRMNEFEFRSLMAEVTDWIENDDWEDLALARGITERGFSEEFSYWLVKEAHVRASHANDLSA